MGKLKYAVHAYAWTPSWNNSQLDLINRAKKLGVDMIEIPLMELALVDTTKIKERLEAVNLGVITSTVLSAAEDITGEDAAVRKAGVEYLKRCVKATADMGATVLGGVLYSAIGRQIGGIPEAYYWERAAKGLKEVAKVAQDCGVTLGLEPINRYETFLVNTCDQAITLIGMIDEPNVGIHLDSYHMNIEEKNFYQPTLKAMPYLCHYHLSESHRGTPGTGMVNWDDIYRALAEGGYSGVVGLESFTEVSDAMRPATCIWRKLAPSSDELLAEGFKYLKGIEGKY